jgi:Na+/H+ antiporter NhaD/arsenite permease-like protein
LRDCIHSTASSSGSAWAIAVATFLIALAIIASEKLHRTNVALLGAAIVVLFVGDFSQEQAIESVDFNTIGLLVGMMILVYLTQQTGVHDYVAIRAGQISGGRSFAVTMSLAAITATLIGDPPNIIIAGATGLSFNAFIVNLAPIVIVTFAVVMPLLYLVFRRRLQVDEKNRAAVMGLNATASIRDAAELRRTGPMLALTVLAFFAHQALHVEPATVALGGASIGLLVTRVDLDKALSSIEWTTLFFFIGLFVMVGALEATGAIGHITDAVKDVTGGERTAELLGIVWVAAIGSAVVDNIPFTTAMIPVVKELQESAGATGDDAYWWSLALGACFGGNATTIAAAVTSPPPGSPSAPARRSAS